MENLTLLNAIPLDQLQTEIKASDDSSNNLLLNLLIITILLIIISLYFENLAKNNKV